MKLELWWIDKTKSSYLEEGIRVFHKRINRFHPLTLQTIKSPVKGKTLSVNEIKKAEGQTVLSQLTSTDTLILLDEKGKSMDSKGFATFIERLRINSHRRVIFLIGGAYGFSPELYARAQYKIQLSEMTFSHQLIRLIFLEQLYRAMTIIHNTPYHNT